ncbi:Phage protein Gp37/Gp68 [Phycisphaerae bacterium RAS1]|nr:Phage protein Gp37/Gp68 [Phycisphaerae bacterium RAS1]
MAHASRIEWTQTTWNPIAGCTKVSAGCANCYAERMSKRLAAMARASRARGETPGRTGNYEHVIGRGGRWNGRVFLDYAALTDPMSWRLPRTIFVNSMSDLFHESVPLDFIRRVFAVMNNCSQHIFQVLTKRPQRAAELSPQLGWTPNIWLGASVENAAVTHRVRDLCRTAAGVRFLSVEPLLGPIPRLPLDGVKWVIVGGESGPGARPIKADWVRQIRDRCLARGVAFFFKQWGGTNKHATGRSLDGRTWDLAPSRDGSPGRSLGGAQG